MKKVVAAQIVGFKNAGKTELCKRLAQYFYKRKMDVIYIKMCHHSLDRANSDTDRLSPHCKLVIGISPSSTGIFYPEKKQLLSLIPLIQGDVVLIEGGKEAIDFIPRIVVADDKEQTEKLAGATTIGIYSKRSSSLEGSYKIFREVEEIALDILEKGFLLPGTNCKGCGFEGCKDLATRILNGEEEVERCKVLNPGSVSIEINGEPLPTNPFVEKIITSTISGLLTPLKGFSKGKLKIEMQVK